MREKAPPSTSLPPSPVPLTDGMAAEGPSTTDDIARRRGFRLRGRTLREHVARGAVINAAFLVGVSALSFIRGFILAAFLSRADYGVWGILSIFVGSMLLFKQVGIGDKYVQQDEEDQELAFQKAFTLEAALTGGLVVLLGALLPLLAIVYGEWKLVLPGIVLLAVLPAGVLQMPIWAYYRRMEFFKQRALLAVDPVIGFAVSITLAIAGVGYWSLVIGTFAGVWAGATVSVLWSPYKLRWRWDSSALRSYASFSWPLFVTVLAAVVIAQSSILTSDAFLGLAGAGAVTLATTISQFTERVDYLITGSLYPAIAAVRERIDLLYESFVKSNRLALMWAMPFGVGLSLFCSDLVSFGIGEEWRPAVILLQVFGVAAGIGHIGFNWDAYFRAVGRTRPMAVASVTAAVVFVASVIPLLATHGLTGFAIAIALQTMAHVACRAYFLSRLFRGFDFFRHAARAMAPTVPAAAAVLLARMAESGERTPLMAVGELALYLAVTAAATLALEGPLLREVLGYLRARADAGAPA
jgi:PST family polysaccharide transporter